MADQDLVDRQVTAENIPDAARRAVARYRGVPLHVAHRIGQQGVSAGESSISRGRDHGGYPDG